MKSALASSEFIWRGEREQHPIPEPACHQWTFPNGALAALFFCHAQGHLIRFPALADFLVSGNGEQVAGWAAPGVDPATVHHLYINQVLPLAMSRQGQLVFHASAVEVDDGCVAFVGRSGLGKSTLAAAFATAGGRFLTDDGLLLAWHLGKLMAVPSHPSIRLWEDSQAALVGAGESLAPAVSYTSKVRVLASPTLAFCDEQRSLRAMFYLDEAPGDTIHIEPLKPSAALMELVRHSFLLDIDEKRMLAAHFDEVSRIANMPIHFRLAYPRDYALLPRVRSTILGHLTTLHR